jgi:hypothetical protein
MNRVFWLHDECLRQPAGLSSTDRWVYVWDDAYFNHQAWSLKRQVFIYETLCELAHQGCEVYQGSTLEVLMMLKQSGLDVMTQAPQDPVLQSLVDSIKQELADLVLTPPPALVDYPTQVAPKRFFQYWKKVETSLLGDSQPSTHHRVR